MTAGNWIDVFSALPDSAFFEIVRHYLGPVSTPFHKPDLISRLATFLSREEVLERAVTYVTREDAFVLSCIAVHKHPSEANLKRIIPNMKPIAFRERVFNLEERLLIWRPGTANQKILALTPLGERLRTMGLVGPGVVIGEPKGRLKTTASRWLNDNWLNSALAFLSETPSLFLKEGGWRKKSVEILNRRFPTLFGDSQGEERVLLIGRGLIAAGLGKRNGEVLQPVLENWREWEGRDAGERKAMLIARSVVGRGLPAETALDVVRTLTECLPAGKTYAVERLVVLVQLTSGSLRPLSPRGARRIISNLALTGELVYSDDDSAGRPAVAEDVDGTVLSLTPAGDITCRPGFPLSCDLALGVEPVSADTVSMFRFTKQRFLTGLDAGITADALFQVFEHHSGRPVPPNLKTLASEWENEYRSLRLHFGVVLEIAGPRRDVIKETGVLHPYTVSQPAEGVWILNRDEESGWRDALKQVGIDHIPPLPDHKGERRSGDLPVLTLPWSTRVIEPPMARENWDMPVFSDFRPTLDALAGDAAVETLSEAERIVFFERLERRLILVSEQIRRGAGRYEATTAKGLDYQGKLRLIEAALSGRNERLSVTVAAGNAVETVMIVPEGLDKEDGEHILTGILLPDEIRCRHMVRKIGFIKRIKASLF